MASRRVKALLSPRASPRRRVASSGPATRSVIRRRLITIRHAIQYRAARLARRARIFHRHHAALAVAGEHAGTDHDRRLVADDDAWMRRDQVRPRAIGPDQGFAGENPAPAVVAGHVHALPGAGLRHRRTGGAQRKRRCQDGESKRPRDRHAIPHRLSCHLSWSIVAGFRFKAWQVVDCPAPDSENYQTNSVNWGNFGSRARRPLQNQSGPFKRSPPERWPSGLRRTLGKRVCGKPYRGFESHSLRQQSRVQPGDDGRSAPGV